MKNKIWFLLITLVLIGGCLTCLSTIYKHKTFFETVESKSAEVDDISEDGEINYLYEDFCGYEDHSLSIDQMEDLHDIFVSGIFKDVALSDNNYGGEKSMQFEIDNGESGQTVVSGKICSDISRWSKMGVYTAWLRLEESRSISSVNLKLVSDKGSRIFKPLQNILSDKENEMKEDDEYPDYYLPENPGDEDRKWEDYMLSSGWNYLFWSADEYSDKGEFNIAEADKYEIIINYYLERSAQTINIDNLRVSDGLQIENNSLAGNWYPPNGMPQYGVFDLAKSGSECYIRLLNVRQDQYPSNGDHTRILSKRTTPENFVAEIEFEAINYQPQTENNSYFRFQYDFDQSYDPGHDWLGAFISFQYDKFGLISVEPVERYFSQKQEPKEYDNNSRKELTLNFDKRYVLNFEVAGQKARALLYEKSNNEFIKYKKVSDISYAFKRGRDFNQERPISIEATGSYHMNLYRVEVLSLDDAK